MLKQPTYSGNYEVALANVEQGIVSIPCRAGTKIPAVQWLRWQTEMPPTELFAKWFRGTSNNIAIITNGLVIFDCDLFDMAQVVIEQCGDTPYKVRTPRGGLHLGYRAPNGELVGNRTKINGLPIDIRGENGLALQPFSRTDLGAYEWAGIGFPAIADLPVAKLGWISMKKRPIQPIEPIDDNVAVRRARAYLATIEGAISGQRGHDRTMRVAGVLIRKFGLTIEQSLPLFRIWNEQCEPSWSEKELLHKLQDAHRLRFSTRGGQS